MSRQVDVKALISHIVRGDGADKCRICMGDTTDGQVYLGDTVMMDGDRGITLSELLETITGVEVPLDGDLPTGLCQSCSKAIIAAGAFRTLCQQSNDTWHTTVQLINTLPDINDIEHRRSVFAVLQGTQMTVVEALCKEEDMKQEVDSVYSELEYMSDENSETETPIIRNGKRMSVKCPNCEKAFLYPKQLYEHLSGSTDEMRACFVCAEIMSRNELAKHLRKLHQREVFCCKKCPALLKSVPLFKKHLMHAHKPGAHVCGECGRCFASAPALHGHVTLHLNKNCPSCDKLFRNRKCYMIHVKKCCNLDLARKDMHRTKSKILFEVQNLKENKKFKVGPRGSADKTCFCNYCGKAFAGKKFVCAHIQIVHMKNTHRPCPYCGKSYAAAHMTDHIKRHQSQTEFICVLCGMVLKTKLGYTQHIRLHTGEKPYKCKYCSETFSASSRRSEHIRKSHKSPQEHVLKHCCDLCSAKFRLPYQLKHHKDSVHYKNDIIKEFECPDCNIKFSSYRGLLYHSRKHQTLLLKSEIVTAANDNKTS